MIYFKKFFLFVFLFFVYWVIDRYTTVLVVKQHIKDVWNFEKFGKIVCFYGIMLMYNNNIIYYDEYNKILMKYINIILLWLIVFDKIDVELV